MVVVVIDVEVWVMVVDVAVFVVVVVAVFVVVVPVFVVVVFVDEVVVFVVVVSVIVVFVVVVFVIVVSVLEDVVFEVVVTLVVVFVLVVSVLVVFVIVADVVVFVFVAVIVEVEVFVVTVVVVDVGSQLGGPETMFSSASIIFAAASWMWQPPSGYQKKLVQPSVLSHRSWQSSALMVSVRGWPFISPGSYLKPFLKQKFPVSQSTGPDIALVLALTRFALESATWQPRFSYQVKCVQPDVFAHRAWQSSALSVSVLGCPVMSKGLYLVRVRKQGSGLAGPGAGAVASEYTSRAANKHT